MYYILVLCMFFLLLNIVMNNYLKVINVINN